MEWPAGSRPFGGGLKGIELGKWAKLGKKIAAEEKGPSPRDWKKFSQRRPRGKTLSGDSVGPNSIAANCVPLFLQQQPLANGGSLFSMRG